MSFCWKSWGFQNSFFPCYSEHFSVPEPRSRLIRSCCSQRPSRIACRVQYDGSSFCGWERKPDLPTVQGQLEAALLDICESKVEIFAASKTDARTHAAGQVFHFEPPMRLHQPSSWQKMMNGRLPSCIVVDECAYAHPEFHARKSASWRRYRYSILNTSSPSVFKSPFSWHIHTPLDVDSMNTAARHLLCDFPQDFSAFRKARSAASHTNICVHDISVQQSRDLQLVEIEVCATWFVYGMMRLLTAALVEVGCKSVSVAEFVQNFKDRRRDLVKTSAPPQGLCLLEVGYPSHLDPFGEKQ